MSCVSGLFLALWFGITLGGVLGTIQGARYLHLIRHVQGKCPTCCTKCSGPQVCSYLITLLICLNLFSEPQCKLNPFSCFSELVTLHSIA